MNTTSLDKIPQSYSTMNTMVGMQASLHTSMQDIEADLTMKNESEPLSTDDIISDNDDDNDEFGESGPGELLRSPPSNNSSQPMNASLDDADELGSSGEGEGTNASFAHDSSGELAETYDQLNANAERAHVLKQQNMHSRQNLQSSTDPVKTSAPNVSPFDRR